MGKLKLQSKEDKQKGVYYLFDTEDAPIGEGGMGKVFKGVCVNEHNGTTRDVAIKFMYTDLPESAYERARRESEIQLRNDNLVEMLAFVETEVHNELGNIQKRYHVVSELLTGVSLSDIFEGKTKDRDGNDVPFAVKMLQEYKNDAEHFAFFVVRNVLSGLLALHDAGYIHRDIDPSNIMLTSDGHVKLIDFGIAKQMNTLTTSDKQLTVAGKFMGKPEYAAPELVLGDVGHQNQTTDIYAVGILLYQCLTGHTPFEGPRHEILEKQLHEKLPLNVIRNKSLRNIISLACQKKQEFRYQSAAQMRVALESHNGSKQAMSTKKKIMIGSGTGIVILILTAILLTVKYKQEQAKTLAEAARIEQINEKHRNALENAISKAMSLRLRAKDREEENFEQNLILSYNTFLDCLNDIESDTALCAYKENILNILDTTFLEINNAREQLDSQAIAFEELDEIQLAEQYKRRADSLNNFIKKIGEKR